MTPQYQAYDAAVPIGYYIAGGIFYTFLIIFLFLGICASWILIRNGKSRALATAMSGIFLFIFFSIAAEGIHILSTIKNIAS